MLSQKQLISKYKKGLNKLYAQRESESIINLTLKHVLSSDGLIKKNDTLKKKEVAKLDAIFKRLLNYEPIQYILGNAHFYGLEFKVDKYVLIPRQETEELVHWIIELYKNKKHLAILDIGTGSGCIAIALKVNLPKANVTAIDYSKEAIKTARKNASKNKVKINCLHQDILNNKYISKHPQYDIIVSNPPYILESEKKLMNKNVLNYEPAQALFVPNDNPLTLYNAIANFALLKLKKNSSLFLEINENIGNKILNMLKNKRFKNCILKKDLNGKDRMIQAIRLLAGLTD